MRIQREQHCPLEHGCCTLSWSSPWWSAGSRCCCILWVWSCPVSWQSPTFHRRQVVPEEICGMKCLCLCCSGFYSRTRSTSGPWLWPLSDRLLWAVRWVRSVRHSCSSSELRAQGFTATNKHGGRCHVTWCGHFRSVQLCRHLQKTVGLFMLIQLLANSDFLKCSWDSWFILLLKNKISRVSTWASFMTEPLELGYRQLWNLLHLYITQGQKCLVCPFFHQSMNAADSQKKSFLHYLQRAELTERLHKFSLINNWDRH